MGQLSWTSYVNHPLVVQELKQIWNKKFDWKSKTRKDFLSFVFYLGQSWVISYELSDIMASKTQTEV